MRCFSWQTVNFIFSLVIMGSHLLLPLQPISIFNYVRDIRNSKEFITEKRNPEAFSRKVLLLSHLMADWILNYTATAKDLVVIWRNG
jgi:hypothetical protein